MTTAPDGNDVPLDWKTPTGVFSTNSVSLKFKAFDSQLFHVLEMWPLPPYRIPGANRALWLLPLVDERFYFRVQRYRNTGEVELPTWEEYFDQFVDELDDTLSYDAIPGEYGEVDERLVKTLQAQPSGAILDIAALSVGLRPIYDPTTDEYQLINSNNSKKIRFQRLAAPSVSDPVESSPSSPMLISGGRCGAAMYPEKLRIWYRNATGNDSNIVDLLRSGVNLDPINVWTSWETVSAGTDSDTDNFCQQIADDAWGWMDSGGQYCFVGVLPPTRNVTPGDYDPGDPESPQPYTANLAACGFDDYFSIQIKEHPKEHGHYVFTHRYYELPPLFLPDVVLVGGKRSECDDSSSGSGNSLLFFTPPEGIPQATADAEGFIFRSASCPAIELSEGPEVNTLRGTLSEELRIYNLIKAPIPGSRIVKASQRGSSSAFFVDVVDCTNSQISLEMEDDSLLDDLQIEENP